jgi:hypothetical protein
MSISETKSHVPGTLMAADQGYLRSSKFMNTPTEVGVLLLLHDAAKALSIESCRSFRLSKKLQNLPIEKQHINTLECCCYISKVQPRHLLIETSHTY